MVIWDWGIAKYSNSFVSLNRKLFCKGNLVKKNDWGL